MFALEDQVAQIPLSPMESLTIAKRLVLAQFEAATIGELAEKNKVKPMRVAQEVVTLRPDDSSLKDLVGLCEKLILKFGTTRVSAEAVEGELRVTDKFWRSNDPMGVYKPGDMFYVDENHRWQKFFPLLILAPTVFCVLVVLLFALRAAILK